MDDAKIVMLPTKLNLCCEKAIQEVRAEARSIRKINFHQNRGWVFLSVIAASAIIYLLGKGLMHHVGFLFMAGASLMLIREMNKRDSVNSAKRLRM